MVERADILLCGTGSFAARILFDLAATAPRPVSVALAGRNAARLAWMRTAALARAAMFGRRVAVTLRDLDLERSEQAAALVATLRPKVVLQAASAQAGGVIAGRANRWGTLVAAAGLSLTAVFQARLSVLASRAVAARSPESLFINCCYPDVANGIIAALGLPITCGIGNVAILANAFGGMLGEDARDLRVLAQYRTIAPFRLPPDQRAGVAPPPRVWLGTSELQDVAARFADVQLTPEPVIDISGAAAVPLLHAIAGGTSWRGHVPGPHGLPGGYPVAFEHGALRLDLPPGLTETEAIAWNDAFERRSGLVIENGTARYTGTVEQVLRSVSPDLAGGFAVRDLDEAYAAMQALRARLQAEPA
ncbi:hypothetical protein [Roseomonas sp. AR75]|uniref:hypothetical protein n=1 Tax=Roseomonas sp. AR75 TaxID=2562311 RepID=UPI00197D3D62|nr:hypothetical protein [Roseomonas sp. AR75]